MTGLRRIEYSIRLLTKYEDIKLKKEERRCDDSVTYSLVLSFAKPCSLITWPIFMYIYRFPDLTLLPSLFSLEFYSFDHLYLSLPSLGFQAITGSSRQC